MTGDLLPQDTVTIVQEAVFPAAGRLWIVVDYRLTPLKSGGLGVTRSELRRIHRAIALAICNTSDPPMSPSEFEFLCDIADVPYAEAAGEIGLHRNAITKWMGRNLPMKADHSNVLKRWFLRLLFPGPALPVSTITEQVTE